MPGVEDRYKKIIMKMAKAEAQKGVRLTDEQRRTIIDFIINKVNKPFDNPKELVRQIEADNPEVIKKYGSLYVKDKTDRAKRRQISHDMRELFLKEALDDQKTSEQYYNGKAVERKALMLFKTPDENCTQKEKDEIEEYNEDLCICFDQEALNEYKKNYPELSDDDVKAKRTDFMMRFLRENEKLLIEQGNKLSIRTKPDYLMKNFKTIRLLTTLAAEAKNVLNNKNEYSPDEADKELLEKYDSYSNVFAVAIKTMASIAGSAYEYIDLDILGHCKSVLIDDFNATYEEKTEQITNEQTDEVTKLCDNPNGTFLKNVNNEGIMLKSVKPGEPDVSMTDFVREYAQDIVTNELSGYDANYDFYTDASAMVTYKNTDCAYKYIAEARKIGIVLDGTEADRDKVLYETKWNEAQILKNEENGKIMVCYALNNKFTNNVPEMLYNDTLYSKGKELLAGLDKAESVLADINDSFRGTNEFKEIKRDLGKVYKLGWLKQGADVTEYEDALKNLSKSCKKYITRKNREHVENPSQRRKKRMEFVNEVVHFAEQKRAELATILEARKTVAEFRKETEDKLLTAIWNQIKTDKRASGEPIKFKSEEVEKVLGDEVIKDCIRESACVKEIFKLKNDDEIIYHSKDVELVKKISIDIFLDRGFVEAYKTAIKNKTAENAIVNPKAGNERVERDENKKKNVEKEHGFKLNAK